MKRKMLFPFVLFVGAAQSQTLHCSYPAQSVGHGYEIRGFEFVVNIKDDKNYTTSEYYFTGKWTGDDGDRRIEQISRLTGVSSRKVIKEDSKIELIYKGKCVAVSDKDKKF